METPLKTILRVDFSLKIPSTSQQQQPADSNNNSDGATKTDVEKCIHILVREKSRSTAIKKKIQDVLNGRHDAAISKSSFGQ